MSYNRGKRSKGGKKKGRSSSRGRTKTIRGKQKMASKKYFQGGGKF